MAEQTKEGDKATTPAASGGLTRDDVNALLVDALKPITEAITGVVKTQTGLAADQKVLADTLAKLPPAQAGAEGGDKTKTKTTESAALTADDVKKLIGEGLTAHQQQQQQTAEQRAARESFIKSDKSGLAKIAPLASALGFDVSSKLGSDQSKWSEEAKAIATGFETFARDNKIPLGDVGGGARDGSGGGAGGGAGGTAGAEQKPGSWIKIPA